MPRYISIPRLKQQARSWGAHPGYFYRAPKDRLDKIGNRLQAASRLSTTKDYKALKHYTPIHPFLGLDTQLDILQARKIIHRYRRYKGRITHYRRGNLD